MVGVISLSLPAHLLYSQLLSRFHEVDMNPDTNRHLPTPADRLSETPWTFLASRAGTASGWTCRSNAFLVCNPDVRVFFSAQTKMHPLLLGKAGDVALQSSTHRIFSALVRWHESGFLVKSSLTGEKWYWNGSAASMLSDAVYRSPMTKSLRSRRKKKVQFQDLNLEHTSALRNTKRWRSSVLHILREALSFFNSAELVMKHIPARFISPSRGQWCAIRRRFRPLVYIIQLRRRAPSPVGICSVRAGTAEHSGRWAVGGDSLPSTADRRAGPAAVTGWHQPAL